MPSPVAHAVSGYALTRVVGSKSSNLGRKITPAVLFYAVFVAIAADFDFIPQLITGADFHRGFTHSLVFAVIFSCILSSIVIRWRKLPYKRVLAMTLLLYLSHLVLDFFTQGGSGIPLLWPWINQPFKSSLSLFPAVHHSRGLLDRSHLIFISFELTYAGLLFLGTWLWQGPRPSKKIKGQNVKL
ncbi:MAG: metal-dependent hydrolase [Cyanobacteria bacterium P01_G01_bin.38]